MQNMNPKTIPTTNIQKENRFYLIGVFIFGAICLSLFSFCNQILFFTAPYSWKGLILPIIIGGISAIFFSRFIIENKKQKKIAESQYQYFQNIFNASPDAICIVDKNAKILQTNPKFYELLKIPNEKILVDDYCFRYLMDESKVIYKNNFNKILEGESFEDEIGLINNAKEIVSVWRKVVPYFDHEGGVVGAMSFDRDISKQIAAQTLYQEHVKEMETILGLTIDRESKMSELKDELELLKAQLKDQSTES